MSLPMMPKATAVWLIENTALSFAQVAAFCGLHELEVQALADGDVMPGMAGLDPVLNGQLTWDEIRRCEADPAQHLAMTEQKIPQPLPRARGARYTPVAKRQDKPDAIAWLLKNHPELTDATLCKLLGTTKSTIQAVRERSHWNATNIRPRDPVDLGLCTYADLSAAVEAARAKQAQKKAAQEMEEVKKLAAIEAARPPAAAPGGEGNG
jgi:hypothetical protein